MCGCLTNTDVPLGEEGVHLVDICHELAVTKGEISDVSARLSSCQHLDQSWKERRPLNLTENLRTCVRALHVQTKISIRIC